MCGIAGMYQYSPEHPVNKETLHRMGRVLKHRGPDDTAHFILQNVGFAFRRLSIMDVQHGQQPFVSEDKQVVLICNGEIFNYKELRTELRSKGYQFSTNCDIEVIIPLYEEYGLAMFNRLNGQFALALYDHRLRRVLFGRDHFGICPLYYAELAEELVFGSEVKALLEHPAVKRDIDLTGLDQLLTLPGNVGARTMFSGIKALPPGNFLLYENNCIKIRQYWDLEYPDADAVLQTNLSENECIEGIDALIKESIRRRTVSDVPIGFYLSGGLDSSLIGGVMNGLDFKEALRSFSIVFPQSANSAINEQYFQRMLSNHIQSQHHEIPFEFSKVDDLLEKVVYHAECPLKETYNVCSFMLADFLNQTNTKVTLSGEGADELFGGYYGYGVDAANANHKSDDPYSEEINQRMWGNPNFTYERNEYEFSQLKKAIYSVDVNEQYDSIDSSNFLEINRNHLTGRHLFHRRSYVDFKVRLSGHLVADHGDRMTSAHGVEGRYPFLDVDLIDFIKNIPPSFMMKGMSEKYILKKVASAYVPQEIITRPKFPFMAPGGIDLLKMNKELVGDYLSYDRIKNHNFFNASAVERLKARYLQNGFVLNTPYETDLIVFILTFEILLQQLKLNTL